VLSPHVARVIVANPLQVKAIAHAWFKTDKVDAGVLASLRAADFLPEIWLPDADTERLRRLTARRNQVVRHRSRIKNEVHAILHAHLIPPCPHADLFGGSGRTWLGKLPLHLDEQETIEHHLRELEARVEPALAISVAVIEPVGRAFISAGAEAFDTGLHQSLQHRFRQRSQGVAVAALPQQVTSSMLSSVVGSSVGLW
jgi:transposase